MTSNTESAMSITDSSVPKCSCCHFADKKFDFVRNTANVMLEAMSIGTDISDLNKFDKRQLCHTMIIALSKWPEEYAASVYDAIRSFAREDTQEGMARAEQLLFRLILNEWRSYVTLNTHLV